MSIQQAILAAAVALSSIESPMTTVFGALLFAVLAGSAKARALPAVTRTRSFLNAPGFSYFDRRAFGVVNRRHRLGSPIAKGNRPLKGRALACKLISQHRPAASWLANCRSGTLVTKRLNHFPVAIRWASAIGHRGTR